MFFKASPRHTLKEPSNKKATRDGGVTSGFPNEACILLLIFIVPPCPTDAK
jgi:hypothetical protein